MTMLRRLRGIVPCVALVAAVGPATAPAQAPADPLNLTFARTSALDPSKPRGWWTHGAGYEIALDSVAPPGARRALRIAARTGDAAPAPTAFGVAAPNAVLPPAVAAGHVVHLSAAVRTRDVARGYAGLWVRADGANGAMLALDNMGDRGVTGTTGWTRCEITMRVGSNATQVVLGVLHPGDGTAWFGPLTIEVDGRPYAPTTTTTAPSAAEVGWVRAHAVPLAGTDPAAPVADLRALDPVVAGARVVALGEGTHGTREFFRMKHRLVEYLAEARGYAAFAIEANMPEARRVNAYVLTGRGDPRAAIRGMYFWTWSTEEVLALVEWTRAYNASGRGRMEFWGFDCQFPAVAMDSVRAFVARADPADQASLDSSYAQVRAAEGERRRGVSSGGALGMWAREAGRVLARVEARRPAYAAAGRDTTEVAWAVQNARLVVQAAGAALGPTSRDSSMAANVAWILAHRPAGAPLVLWAHNGHVRRTHDAMGAHLAARFGTAYRAIGFALGDGAYTAWDGHGTASFTAEAPAPGSVEASLRAAGRPVLALDLRAAAASRDGAWLAEPHPFRMIGALPVEDAFTPTSVARDYDALVYVDHTTASVPLVTVPVTTVPARPGTR